MVAQPCAASCPLPPLRTSAFAALSCLTLTDSLQIINGFVRDSGGVPERSKGADCKSAGSAFEGSNPSPSTKRIPRMQMGSERTGSRSRGCSSMVEQKPSKLTTRVRFPSPAPKIFAGDRVGHARSAGFSGPCSSVVEHSLGKGEVARSIRAMGTSEPAIFARLPGSRDVRGRRLPHDGTDQDQLRSRERMRRRLLETLNDGARDDGQGEV